MQWLMLQQEKPEDFVIATGKQYSVRNFVEWSAAELGIVLSFHGKGLEEYAQVAFIEKNSSTACKVGDIIMRVDERYYRPAEVETLLGNPAKAKDVLGWQPTISARELCSEMIEADLIAVQDQFRK